MGRRVALAAVFVASGLAGCAPPPPAGGPPRVALIDGAEVAGGAGIALSSSGRRIDVAPPAGLCASPDVVHAAADAAVAMLTPCSGRSPRLVRMVAVSAAPLADDARLDAALDEMVARAGAPGGWRALGLDLGGAVEVISAERAGDAAYFVVEDAAPGAGATLGRRCRAFAQIGERLVVATVAARAGQESPPAGRLKDEAERIIAAMVAANPASPALLPIAPSAAPARPVPRPLI